MILLLVFRWFVFKIKNQSLTVDLTVYCHMSGHLVIWIGDKGRNHRNTDIIEVFSLIAQTHISNETVTDLI